MYGPMSGSMGIGFPMNELAAKPSEPCRSTTQTQEQLARMEKELGRLNELRDALEHALIPILRGDPNANGPVVGKERSPLVPLAEAISRFCEQANATGNALEGLLRRIEL